MEENSDETITAIIETTIEDQQNYILFLRKTLKVYALKFPQQK